MRIKDNKIKQPLEAVNQVNNINILPETAENCNSVLKDSFLLHNSHKEIIEALTDEEAGQLLKGLFKYNCGENPNFTGTVQIAFIPIRQL